MTVPTYDQFIEPIQRFLADQPNGAAARDAHAAAAHALAITYADKGVLLPSGHQQICKPRRLGARPTQASALVKQPAAGILATYRRGT